MPKQVSKHVSKRERVADAAGGGGIGILIVWILTLFGIPVTPAAAAVLTTMIIAVAAALGRDGIRGIVIKLWRGANGNGKE